MSDEDTYKKHDKRCCCVNCAVVGVAFWAADEIERLQKECERLAKRNALLVVEIEQLKMDYEWACKCRDQLAVAVRDAHAELGAHEQQEEDR